VRMSPWPVAAFEGGSDGPSGGRAAWPVAGKAKKAPVITTATITTARR